MKKYITIAALLAAGTAMVNADATIVTFANSDEKPDFATDNFKLDGLPNSAGASTQTLTLSDTTVLSAYNSGGRFWNYTSNATTTWTNSDALADLNGTLGVSWESSNLLQPYVATAAGGSISTLTFDFNENSEVVAGTELAFYFVVASSSKDNLDAGVPIDYSGFNVSAGLTNVSVSWATAAGTGYTNATLETKENASLQTTNLLVSQDELALIKVTGTLTDSQSVAFKASSQKNGWAMASYTVVPEPSAFGLLAGIGALALVASRRRRK